MRKDQIQEVNKLRNQVPEAFGEPASEEEIINAERKLGTKLPEEYKVFLREFGAGGVGGAIILGLSEAEFLYTPSFVDISLQFRKQFRDDIPEYGNLVVIGIDGSGNPIGYLPNNTTIFVNDHDFGGRYDVANDFCDYIDKALSGTLDISF